MESCFAAERDCSEGNARLLADGWLQQELCRVCGTLERDYFLLLEHKSL